MGGRLGALVQRLRLLISHLRVAHSASQTAATSPPARFGSPAPGQWAGVSSSAPGGEPTGFGRVTCRGPGRWAISSRAGQGGHAAPSRCTRTLLLLLPSAPGTKNHEKDFAFRVTGGNPEWVNRAA